MKRKLMILILSAFVVSFIGCKREAYRIVGFESIEFYEQDTYSHDVWHGYPFNLAIAFELKAINPLYVRLESVSLIEECRAMMPIETLYTNEPDLNTATLCIDKDLVFNGTDYPAGSNLLVLASDFAIRDRMINIGFSTKNNRIDIADGATNMEFSCLVGGKIMSVSKRLTIDLAQ